MRERERKKRVQWLNTWDKLTKKEGNTREREREERRGYIRVICLGKRVGKKRRVGVNKERDLSKEKELLYLCRIEIKD
jgi:hypothetical protein